MDFIRDHVEPISSLIADLRGDTTYKSIAPLNFVSNIENYKEFGLDDSRKLIPAVYHKFLN